LSAMRENTLAYQRSGGRETFSSYYTTDATNVVLRQWLGKNVVFSQHNLVCDGAVQRVSFDPLPQRHDLLRPQPARARPYPASPQPEHVRFSRRRQEGIDPTHADRGLFSRARFAREPIPKDPMTPAVKVVAVGASLGRPRRVRHAAGGLPPSFGCPLVLVQHRRADTESRLVELLGNHSPLPVSEPDDKEPMEPGHVLPGAAELSPDRRARILFAVDRPAGLVRAAID